MHRAIQRYAEGVDVRVVPMVVVVCAVVESLGIQPAAHVGDLIGWVEQPRVQDRSGIDDAVARLDDRGGGVQGMQTIPQGGGIGEIGLRQHDAVGDGNLTHGLGVGIQMGHAVRRVDRGDNAIQAVDRGKDGIGHQCRQDRGRIGQTGCLDRDTRDFASARARQHFPQHPRQIAAHGAT